VSESLHHIRLLAGFEVRPESGRARILDKAASERLAAALAQDLARVVESARAAMLIVGGSLLEPTELLRPGFVVWQALADLARPVIRDHGTSGQVLAIGGHGGRLPDARLSPAGPKAAGHFLAIPLLLICEAEDGPQLEAELERELFERGAVQPPARAILAESTGVDSVHGQLLTLNDQLALQHVQMDTAGLGGFWPVVQQALLDPDSPTDFDLPGAVQARWSDSDRQVDIEFLSFDQFGSGPDDYALWVRAWRSLTLLLDSHAIAWQACSDLDHDEEHDCLVEDAGPTDQADGLTIQVHPDCGLIAWTRVRSSQQHNIYPLSARGFSALRQHFADQDPIAHTANAIWYDAATQKLTPAS
jgi:hypothetical protein